MDHTITSESTFGPEMWRSKNQMLGNLFHGRVPLLQFFPFFRFLFPFFNGLIKYTTDHRSSGGYALNFGGLFYILVHLTA
jgi:hypothetical protein